MRKRGAVALTSILSDIRATAPLVIIDVGIIYDDFRATPLRNLGALIIYIQISFSFSKCMLPAIPFSWACLGQNSGYFHHRRIGGG